MFWGPAAYEQSLILRGHICVRCADHKQPLGQVSPHYTTHVKNVKSQYYTTWDQATGLGVMIGRCSPHSQHGRPTRHPTNVGCSFFRYLNEDVTNEQRPKRRT